MDTNLSEKEYNACQELFKKTHNIDHSQASFFGHLYNTFYILKRIGASEITCLAGLYHAVYGTEYFNLGMIFEESEVIDLIGEESSKLIKYFSHDDRNSVILDNSLNLDKKTLLSLIEILYANYLEQSRGNQLDEKYFSLLTNQIYKYREEIKVNT
jgi:hypothetical protein